jgi:hypothetical protein
VSVLSPTACAALTAVVLASAAWAFLGPPARRPRRSLARRLLGVTAVLYLLGAGLAGGAGLPWPGVLVVVAGIEVSCLGAWLVRGEDPPGEDDDEPSPWDWDAFDRARVAWARRPAGV